MNFYKHPSFQAFSKTVKESLKNKSNLLIISVPGMSVTFYIKKFLEKEKNSDYKYIRLPGKSLSKFGFLDLDFDSNERALVLAEGYFAKANFNQRLGLVVNTPYILGTETFNKSKIGSHIYNTYHFKVLDKELIKVFADIINVKLSEKNLKRIIGFSGGLTRIVKFLLTHEDTVKLTPEKILKDKDFMRVFLPSAEVIEKCDDDTLQRLGFKNNGDFVGEILKRYFAGKHPKNVVAIKINPDLTFSELGELNNYRFNVVEKKILEKVIQQEGFITKESIADIKWGEGSYDKYSDQAISKTMQRLEKKLQKHIVEPIPKVGYKIITKLL